MSTDHAFDDADAARPAPGWLLDPATNQVRWWDGRQWTNLSQPMQPAHYAARPVTKPSYTPYSSVMSAPAPLTSKNGPAKASLILILLLVLGVGAIVWLVTGRDPWVAIALGLINLMMVIAALVLAIIGLVIAVRRPTRKRESIFGIVVSSLMLLVIIVRVAMVVGALAS